MPFVLKCINVLPCTTISCGTDHYQRKLMHVNYATYAKPNFGTEKIFDLLLSPTHSVSKRTVKTSRTEVSSCKYLSTIVLMLSGDVSMNPSLSDTDSHIDKCFKGKDCIFCISMFVAFSTK